MSALVPQHERPQALRSLLERVQDTQHGFYLAGQVGLLAELDRLRLVLIRFGNGRCLAPAQDALYIASCVEQAGGYVRDYSIPHGQEVLA